MNENYKKFNLREIFQISGLYRLLISFNDFTNIPFEIMNPDDRVIFSVGRQEICKKFHRICDGTLGICKSKALKIAQTINEKKDYLIFDCPNGLKEAVCPIIVDEIHIGNVFFGQFLFESPDKSFFKKHAEKYGFNSEKYFAAVSEIPIREKSEIENAINFFSGVVNSFVSFANQKLAAENEFLKYQTLFNNSTSILIRITKDFNILQINKSGLTFFDMQEDELIGQNLLSRFISNEQEKKRIATELDKIYSSLNQVVSEKISFEITTLNGESKVLEFEFVIKREKKISESIILISGQDITTILRQKLNLKKSEQKLRLAQKMAKIGNWELNLENNEIIFSEEILNIFKLPGDNLKQSLDFFLSKINEKEDFIDDLHKLKNHGIDLNKIYSLTSESQAGQILQVIGKRLFNEKGKLENIQGTIQDISELKKAEKEASEREKLFKNLFYKIPLAAFLHDLPVNGEKAKFHMVNEAACKLLGFEPDELIKLSANEISEICTDQNVNTFSREVVKNGLLETNDNVIGKSGNKIPVKSLSKLVDFEGKPSCITILTDLTLQNKLEEQMRQNQKMEAIGQLAAGVAHDFNNLLQIIQGYSEFLEEFVSKDKDALFFLTSILNAADRGRNLVDQLMLFSRKEELDSFPLNIKSIVNSLYKMLSRLIGNHVKLSIEVSPEDFFVFGDQRQIEHALLNLCINSRDALPKRHGWIKISVKSASPEEIKKNPISNNFVCVEISDNGSGIPKEVQDRIFEPFFTTKEVGKGTGLGLSSAFAIIKKHHGYVEFDSEVGHGTSFRLFFPLIEFGPEVIEKTNKENTSNGENKISGKTEEKLTILVAEDDPLVRELTCSYISKFGFSLVVAHDGQQAVELFNDNKDEISMLVFDVMMPRLNGREAYDVISKLKPGIPVIFITGYSDDLLDTNFVKNMPGKIIRKPYKAAALHEAIREITEKFEIK